MVDTGDGKPVRWCAARPTHARHEPACCAARRVHSRQNMTLAVGHLRGVESRGMLVSEFELQIPRTTRASSICRDAPIGKKLRAICRARRSFDSTSIHHQSPGLHGVNGIARDLAAAMSAPLSNTPKVVPGTFPCPVAVKLDLRPTHPLCPAFARLVRGVKNGRRRMAAKAAHGDRA